MSPFFFFCNCHHFVFVLLFCYADSHNDSAPSCLCQQYSHNDGALCEISVGYKITMPCANVFGSCVVFYKSKPGQAAPTYMSSKHLGRLPITLLYNTLDLSSSEME